MWARRAGPQDLSSLHVSGAAGKVPVARRPQSRAASARSVSSGGPKATAAARRPASAARETGFARRSGPVAGRAPSRGPYGNRPVRRAYASTGEDEDEDEDDVPGSSLRGRGALDSPLSSMSESEDEDGAATRVRRAPDTVVIHVCDEHRKIERDFQCEKSLLVREMRYFASYLADTASTDEIDISVHCDVHIFAWLVGYIQGDPKCTFSSLEVGNAISVLISSEFLQMDGLIGECIQFVADHLEAIVRLPIDLSCVNDELVARMAKRMDVSAIEAVHDRRDKIVSRLYMAKLETLLAGGASDDGGAAPASLVRCQSCGMIYASSHQEWALCRSAKIFIDLHGSAIAQHVPDGTWDLNAYLVVLRARKMTWREIYWRLWGLLHALYCATCEAPFVAAHYAHCSFHPLSPVFAGDGAVGTYPCCSAQALRFDTDARKAGCRARKHSVKCRSKADEAVLARLIELEDVVCIPFDDAARDDGAQLEMAAVEQFYAADTASGAGNGAATAGATASGGRARARAAASPLASSTTASRRQKPAPSLASPPANLPPKRKRMWRLDAMRAKDRERMDAITARLEAMREPPPAGMPRASVPHLSASSTNLTARYSLRNFGGGAGRR